MLILPNMECLLYRIMSQLVKLQVLQGSVSFRAKFTVWLACPRVGLVEVWEKISKFVFDILKTLTFDKMLILLKTRLFVKNGYEDWKHALYPF